MKVYIYSNRPAIAMIELIFAIVVIGITLMSAPTLIAQATNSATVTYKQESIAIVAAHANHILTYPWDEQNNHAFATDILQVTHGDTRLDANANGVRQAAGPAAFTASRARRFNLFDNPAASAVLDSDGSETESDYDDMDDFVGDNITLAGISGTNNHSNDGEYIDKTMKLVTTVNYSNDTANYGNPNSFTINTISDTAAAGSTNIKYATITISSTSGAEELSDSITLHAFMCNIGGANIETVDGI